MNAHMSVPELGQGFYPLPEAARLAQIDTRTARRWAEGYDFVHLGAKRHSAGVINLSMSRAAGELDLTFAEMLTLRLVKGFRGAGFSLRTIKRVAALAAVEYRTPTPFVTKQFRTDGRKVFVEIGHVAPSNDEPLIPRRERQLIEVLSRQHQFADVVEPSLYKRVEWEDDMVARWWPMGRDHSVVLDPKVMFGAPRVAQTRLPTEILAKAVRAEGGGDVAIQAVADWHGVTAKQVRDAVEFETGWLRQAA
jgi:uncharacterized protein (DUF433 family)